MTKRQKFGILKERKERRWKMVNGLCAGAGIVVFDIIVFAAIVLASLACGRKGFISCLFGIVSNLAAFLIALSLANVFLNITGGLFGLQGVFENNFEEFFAKLSGFDVDISGVDIHTTLESNNVPAILAKLVIKITGGGEVPVGTTLASLLGEATASLAATLISGAVLFVLVKVGVFFLKATLGGIISRMNLLRGINTLLGSFFGLLYALLIVCVVLAVLAVIPINGISEFLSSGLLIGALYENNLLIIMLSWFI